MKRFFILIVTMTACIAAWAAEPYVVYTSNNTTLTFYYGTKPNGAYGLNTGIAYPGWYYDGTYANVTRVVFNSSFAQARPTITNYWFYKMENLTAITGLNYLNTSEVIRMMYMFNDCKNLTNLNLSSFNTEKVTDIFFMFSGCESLTSLDVSSFNTSNVTDMTAMFANCKKLTSLDLSNFNTSSVTTMKSMFSGCESLSNLNISSFNTSNVVNMWAMFDDCDNLTSFDLSHFDTSKVEEMGSMFSWCDRLSNLNLSSFNTSNVIHMDHMFSGCASLKNLDLCSFNTSKVANMNGMFDRSTQLKTVKVSSEWSTDRVVFSDDMFFHCYSLEGGEGTIYDSNHVNKDYARIDGGPSYPGYLTGEVYDLWVNGVQVTGANKNGVTGPGISGSVTYEPSTNTLTLNNATIDQRGLSVCAIENAYGAPTNLKIKLVGDNKILANINTVAINLKESQGFTLYGSGTLNCGGALYLDARSYLTNDATISYIKDCSVHIDQIISEDYEECLTIDNADVTTEYLSVGSDHNGYKGLNLINCYVASPTNGVVGDVGCIMVNGQVWQGHVEIKHSGISGDVNGDGAVTSADITTLYDYLLNNDTSSIVNGDVDGDGFITSGDVTAVYNIMLGN